MMRAAFLAVLVLVAAEAAACICLQVSPKSAFKRANAVFIGEVIDEDEYGDVRVRVLQRFKGETAEIVKLRLHRASSCMYVSATPAGSRHLIYGQGQDDSFDASQCSRSAAEEQAALCDLRYVRSRAAWWRSRLSDFRPLLWLTGENDPC